MIKRALDVVLAAIGLTVAVPVVIVAAAGIKLASPGPVLYRAVRIGTGRRPFTLYKLRTMHAGSCATGSTITAAADPRVFAFGAWLRKTKIDELPQLLNVLRGDMSIVGPRPEDPGIVDLYYTPLDYETLTVRPGLTSPGSLYSCAAGEALVDTHHPEESYVRDVLPLKLALDISYVRNATLGYDLSIIARTAQAILARFTGAAILPMIDPSRHVRAVEGTRRR